MDWHVSVLGATFLIVAAAAWVMVGVLLRHAARQRRIALALIASEQNYRELYAALSRQEQERILIDRVRNILAQELDLDTVIRTVVDSVHDIFGYPLVGLYLLDGEVLKLQYVVGLEKPVFEIPITTGVVGKVARTGRPIWLVDAHGDPDFLESAEGITSEICVPLSYRERVVGVFNVESQHGVVLTENDLRLIMVLGDQISIALGRARAYAAMSALYDTSLEINAQTDLPKLLEAITRRAADLLGVYMGGLYLISSSGDCLELVVTYNLPEHYRGSRLALGEGVSGRVAQTGEALMIADYQAWEAQVEVFRPAGFRRVLAVPLKSGQQVIGVINIADARTAGAFSPQEIRLVSLFADQAVLAIKNARLLAEARDRAEELAVLNRIGQAVVSNLDLDQTLQTLYDQCRQVLPIEAFYVAVYDEASGQISHPFFTDQEQIIPVSARNIYAQPGLSGETILRRQTIYLPDMLDPETMAAHQIIHAAGKPVRSYVGVPLIFHNRVVGAISMQSYQPYAFSAGQIKLLETIAYRAASAIEHARLFNELHKTTRSLALLNEITWAALQAVDMNVLLQTLAEQLARLFYADGCYITSWDERQQLPIPAAAYGEQLATYPESGLAPGTLTMTGSVLNARRPLVAEDVFNSPYLSPEVAARYPARSLLGLPLRVGEQKLGAALIAFNQSHSFSQSEIQLGEQAANQIALALAKSRSAVIDPLTGAYNRRGLFELGLREVERSLRYGSPLSVILLDIDHFKNVNDQYGHAVGDQVLRMVVHQCIQSIRTMDILGRYGGEEFAILLPQSDRLAARQAAERLCSFIRRTPIPIQTGEVTVTVSIGVASLNGTASDLDSLIKLADDAMYTAKQAGRDRVMVYHPPG